MAAYDRGTNRNPNRANSQQIWAWVIGAIIVIALLVWIFGRNNENEVMNGREGAVPEETTTPDATTPPPAAPETSPYAPTPPAEEGVGTGIDEGVPPEPDTMDEGTGTQEEVPAEPGTQENDTTTRPEEGTRVPNGQTP